jgi:hypothetical protein
MAWTMGRSVVCAATRKGISNNPNKNTGILQREGGGEAARYDVVPENTVIFLLPRPSIGFRPGTMFSIAKQHHLKYQGKSRTLGIQ